MKDDLDVAKGIIGGILIGAIIWAIIVLGGIYAYRHFVVPVQHKIEKTVEINHDI